MYAICGIEREVEKYCYFVIRKISACLFDDEITYYNGNALI